MGRKSVVYAAKGERPGQNALNAEPRRQGWEGRWLCGRKALEISLELDVKEYWSSTRDSFDDCHLLYPLRQQDLYRILKAYTIYRPDEGYCQAQAPVAAVLLMHMPAEVSISGPVWGGGEKI